MRNIRDTINAAANSGMAVSDQKDSVAVIDMRGKSTTAAVATHLASSISSRNSSDVSLPLFFDLIPVDVISKLVLDYADLHTKCHIDQVYSDPIIKASAIHARDKSNQFMGYVQRAEQDEKHTSYEAEKMLQDDPSLAQMKGLFVFADGSARMMTAFQKAFFSLDWHLWKRIKNYISEEDIKNQLQEHIDVCREAKRPIHVNITRLTSAYNTSKGLIDQERDSEANARVITEIGGAQRELLIDATNIMHVYCHPNRPLKPCPDFKNDEIFPRSLKTCKPDINLLPLFPNDGLGFSFYVSRAPRRVGLWREEDRGALACTSVGGIEDSDLEAITAYVNQGVLEANILLNEYNLNYTYEHNLNPMPVAVAQSSWMHQDV